MDNMIGKLLDNRYELLEVIGTGGMAMVYKAQDRRLNRSVAVKILAFGLVFERRVARIIEKTVRSLKIVEFTLSHNFLNPSLIPKAVYGRRYPALTRDEALA